MTVVVDGTSGITTNSGTLISATTIGVGGATPSTSGAGITFPVTQSASSNANTLDDYEEGTWTPSFTLASGSATATTALGSYVKIGRQVSLTMLITFSVPTAASIDSITGLPFSAENTQQRAIGALRENAMTGYMWQMRPNTNATTAIVAKYDNTQVLIDAFSFLGTVVYFTT
jgi:hypothetical protein